MSSDDHEPSWLDSSNDDKIRKENEPLLGSGTVNLQDPSATNDPEIGKRPTANETYGAVETMPTPIELMDTEAVLKQAAEAKYQPVLLHKPHVPPQNACLWMFHLLEGIAIITSLCLFATQALPLFLTSARKIGLLSLALRIYISLFCILFVSTEFNLQVPLIRSSTLLQQYLSRGFLYSFIGLVCVQEAYSEQVQDIVAHQKDDAFRVGWTAVFMQLSSWFMLGTGCVYMLLGLCCMKGVRDRMKQKEVDDWKQYREDMKKWKDLHG